MSDINRYRLIQISDLHFSDGAAEMNSSHKHSITHLVGLERRIKSEIPDRVIVTGDLSNYGDPGSLLRASDWLFREFAIGNGRTTGLKLDKSIVRIVPGNHDAWDNGTATRLAARWQSSLHNYNSAFLEFRLPEESRCCAYDWLERGGSGIYFAFADSSYLGDPEVDVQLPRIFDRVARGKLSLDQSQQLLVWYDAGMRGQLAHPADKAVSISAEKFAAALKVLVMHHYLFEPTGMESERRMQISDRHRAFRNIALADFDVLMCGHKHVADFHGFSYGRQFDHRARVRYLLNCFRRMVGISSLPDQYRDSEGRWLSKMMSTVLNLLAVLRRYDPESSSVGDLQIALENALENPESLNAQLTSFLRRHARTGARVFERDEIVEIREAVANSITRQNRENLRAAMSTVKRHVAALDARPFVQVVCGSSAKMQRVQNAERSFNTYEVTHEKGKWRWCCRRYSWDATVGAFSDAPLMHCHEFEATRTLRFN